MKRFAILTLVAAFVMSAVSAVSAADLEISGSWRVAGHFMDSDSIATGEDDGKDTFHMASRARTTFEFLANEHLKAVTEFEFFNRTWGEDFGVADQHNVTARQAFIAFDIPNAPVYIQAGLQEFATPSATEWFSPLDDPATGIVAATKFNDMMTMNLGWFRIDDASEYDKLNEKKEAIRYTSKDEADVFYADLAVNGDGYSVTPWILYAMNGENSLNKGNDIFYAAVSGTLNIFDPLTFAADLYYGKTDVKHGEDGDAFGAVFKAAYAMDMFTPELLLGYFSGSDKGKGDVMPMADILSPDVYTTTFAFDGSALGGGNWIEYLSDVTGANGYKVATQSFIMGVSLKDISFVECMSHDLNLFYLKGTSDKGTDYFNKDEKLFTVDFNTKYQIYEQLAAIAEIGYAKLDTANKDADGFGLTLGIKYDF